ncbi:MAG TPA: molybdopterin biosynthesis protein [Gemmatimonadales bacterium]|nr:molybdopterin biosynthesis protein [Gemmatimonadales bacterium]
MTDTAKPVGGAGPGRPAASFEQSQFLDVIDRDEAERRFRAALDLDPIGQETVPLADALGRTLAHDIAAPVDVPGFDRSNVDGYAVRAEDTFGATEERPRRLRVNAEIIATGVVPAGEVQPGTATVIATGGMLPRGADAVVMVEQTRLQRDQIAVVRPVVPGAAVTFAGSDIGRGEVVLRRGELLSSRETGVLAALGIDRVPVHVRPKVAILSTGDELVAPGAPARPGLVYDSNATILADAVRELGGEPVRLGIVPDDEARLDEALHAALCCDVVLLSGGTSKGGGDLSYRAVAKLAPPGIVAHGVALKPGKPICLAATTRAPGGRRIPVVILPGFPTSAIFTFHEFVAPVIRALAGRREESAGTVSARLPMRVNSERGRTEYLLVGLVDAPDGLAAYPMGKGSGSVTAFSRADGFVVIPRSDEQIEAGTVVQVRLLGRTVEPADLVAIGSHCVGQDLLLGLLHERGFRTKSLAVGSMGGLAAARRGECDVAGIHLLDPDTDTYNTPFLDPSLTLVRGYGRMQGIVFRPGDERFAGRSAEDAVARALADPHCRMVNRNRGSGTRVLIDRLLGDAKPPGYHVEVKSHNAAAAAVAQQRADWGVAIETVARDAGLGFLPLREEQFDFVVPTARLERPAVQAFIALLADPAVRAELTRRGFRGT